MQDIRRSAVIAAVAVACLASPPASPGTSTGLSAVRAQRFGNDDLSGIFTPQTSDRFAFALAAGDFNGDGADDLATGMPSDNGPAANPLDDSGSVVVRYSDRGSGLTTNLSQVYLRQQSNPPEVDDNFGWSLAACDFNDDGFDDLAVGAPREDYLGEDNAGIVHVYYGSIDGLHAAEDSFFAQSTPGVPEDVETGDKFGRSLACGDFDNDGFDDLAVGAPDEAWGGVCPIPFSCPFSKGNVFVVPGSAAGLAYASTTNLGQDGPGMIDEGEDLDRFGESLAAGDFDGDGYDDLAVGVPGEDGEGAIQVVFGGPGGVESTRNVIMRQDQAGGGGTSHEDDFFGQTLAAADFDGDGFADLAVGAPYKDNSAVNDCGQVTVLFGTADGFDLGRTRIVTEDEVFGDGTSEGNDYFGLALATGDFNHDGFDDLAIGHPNETVVGGLDGAVTVLEGSSGGIPSGRQRQFVGGLHGIPGNLVQAGERFGGSLASGDFDGDGHADLAIGSPYENEGGIVDVGAEAVLYGAIFADGVESGNTNFWPQTISFPNGNTIQASTAARLGPASSRFGLEVELYDPTPLQPAQPAFVRAGTDAGIVHERALAGTFFVDPQDLTMSPNPGVNVFTMLAFADGFHSGAKTRLTFDLNRNDSVGGWALLATYFDERLNAMQFAGGAGFALVDPRTGGGGRNNRIDFAWEAGDPGRLAVWHTLYVDGVPDRDGKRLLFSVLLPSSGGAFVSHVFAGMVSGQDRGTFGSFYLDELSFRRADAAAFAPPPPR